MPFPLFTFSVMIINNHYFLKFLINQSVCLIFIFIFVYGNYSKGVFYHI